MNRKTFHRWGGYSAGFYWEGCAGDRGLAVWQWLDEHLDSCDYSFHEHLWTEISPGRGPHKPFNICDHSIWFRRERDEILFALRWKGTKWIGERYDFSETFRQELSPEATERKREKRRAQWASMFP